MMPTKHEAVILALVEALQDHPAEVMREAVLPAACPAQGLLNVVDEDPVEAGFQLGTGVREWQRQFSLELVVTASDDDARKAALDAGLAVAADLLHGQTLDGLVTFLLIGPPEGADDIPMANAVDLRGAVVPVTLFYETSDNPMEMV